MPRTDKSVAILTGMIIAALYVIMLVGFSRESYMRRDAEILADLSKGWSVIDDASNRICRIDRPACPPASPWRADGAAEGEAGCGGRPFRIAFPALYWFPSSTTERR